MSARPVDGTVAPHVALGQHGEDLAARYLERKGYRIVARNWRHKSWELDIIAVHPGKWTKPDTLVFVEVKTRGAGALGRPDQGITPAKIQSLCKGASMYLAETNGWDQPCRFDLISVVVAEHTSDVASQPGLRKMWGRNKQEQVQHIVDAFEFSPTVGGGHASWQPW